MFQPRLVRVTYIAMDLFEGRYQINREFIFQNKSVCNKFAWFFKEGRSPCDITLTPLFPRLPHFLPCLGCR